MWQTARRAYSSLFPRTASLEDILPCHSHNQYGVRGTGRVAVYRCCRSGPGHQIVLQMNVPWPDVPR